MDYQHTPVMLMEVMTWLAIKPAAVAIDCTLGGGSYTLALARAVGKTGRVLSIDLDQLALVNARRRLDEQGVKNARLLAGNFRDLSALVAPYLSAKDQVMAIVLDLGLSSAQLDDQERGFSFQTNTPLDMSFAGQSDKTWQLINKLSATDLAALIKEYGEEPQARAIARAIVARRRQSPLATTGDLLMAIKQALPPSERYGQRVHFATKTWQALRVATNEELVNLRQVLPAALDLLAPGGRLAVVSFHSLEDRLVKQFMQTAARSCLCPPKSPLCVCGHRPQLRILTRGVVRPTAAEIAANPRARSAKLRVAEKIA